MLRLILLFGAVLLWMVADAQTYSITVKLINEKGDPLSGVNCVMQNNNIKPQYRDSHYVFHNLLPGNYNIAVSKKEYTPLNKLVMLVDKNIELLVILNREALALEEVIIFNHNPNQRKNENHLNLEIVTANFIQKNLGGSLMQTLDRLPGVKTINIGSGQSKPVIRGLGFNRVVVLDKGIKHEGQQWGADHGLEIDQFAAGEIEILKGAASFAHGSDAIAGAINIKAPNLPRQNSFGGEVNIIGKSNNALYGGSVSLYARSKKWFTTAQLTMQDYGDYRTPIDTIFVYDYPVHLHKNYIRNTAGKELNLHLSAGYITDKFRSVFYGSNINNKNGFFANAHGLEPRNVDISRHDADNRDILMPYQQVNHRKLINRTAFRFKSHSIEAELGYQHNQRKEFNPYVTHGYMPAVYPAEMAIPQNLERDFEKQVYALNINDVIKWGAHELKMGVNAEMQKNSINGWSFLVPAFNQKSLGAFVYNKIHINKKALLHGALRYDHSRINILRYADWFVSPVDEDGQLTVPTHIVRAENTKRNFNSLTGSLGINYILETVDFKANIGKSFRVPIAKELAANGVNYHYFSYEKGNPALDPEESYQADLTVRWHKRNLEIQLSPFYNYFPNYIYLNPTPDHDYLYGAGNQVFEYRQSRVMRYGAELQLKYRLNKYLRAELLAEYLYAEQLSGDKKGFSLPFSPPPTALVNLTYEPLKTGPFHKTYFSIDWRLSAAQHNIVPPERKTNGYAVINIQTGTRFNIKKQELHLSMQLQNALNARYMLHTSFYRLIGLPEQGRNWILSLKIPFNFLNNTNTNNNEEN